MIYWQVAIPYHPMQEEAFLAQARRVLALPEPTVLIPAGQGIPYALGDQERAFWLAPCLAGYRGLILAVQPFYMGPLPNLLKVRQLAKREKTHMVYRLRGVPMEHMLVFRGKFCQPLTPELVAQMPLTDLRSGVWLSDPSYCHELEDWT